MPYLTLDGITIPVARAQVPEVRAEYVADIDRSVDGTLLADVVAVKRRWRLRTPPLPRTGAGSAQEIYNILTGLTEVNVTTSIVESVAGDRVNQDTITFTNDLKGQNGSIPVESFSEETPGAWFSSSAFVYHDRLARNVVVPRKTTENLVTNGNFVDGLSGWTVSGSVTAITTNPTPHGFTTACQIDAGGGTSYIEQNITGTAGRAGYLAFEVLSLYGDFEVMLGSTHLGRFYAPYWQTIRVPLIPGLIEAGGLLRIGFFDELTSTSNSIQITGIRLVAMDVGITNLFTGGANLADWATTVNITDFGKYIGPGSDTFMFIGGPDLADWLSSTGIADRGDWLSPDDSNSSGNVVSDWMTASESDGYYLADVDIEFVDTTNSYNVMVGVSYRLSDGSIVDDTYTYYASTLGAGRHRIFVRSPAPASTTEVRIFVYLNNTGGVNGDYTRLYSARLIKAAYVETGTLSVSGEVDVEADFDFYDTGGAAYIFLADTSDSVLDEVIVYDLSDRQRIRSRLNPGSATSVRIQIFLDNGDDYTLLRSRLYAAGVSTANTQGEPELLWHGRSSAPAGILSYDIIPKGQDFDLSFTYTPSVAWDDALVTSGTDDIVIYGTSIDGFRLFRDYAAGNLVLETRATGSVRQKTVSITSLTGTQSIKIKIECRDSVLDIYIDDVSQAAALTMIWPAGGVVSFANGIFDSIICDAYPTVTTTKTVTTTVKSPFKLMSGDIIDGDTIEVMSQVIATRDIPTRVGIYRQIEFELIEV